MVFARTVSVFSMSNGYNNDKRRGKMYNTTNVVLIALVVVYAVYLLLFYIVEKHREIPKYIRQNPEHPGLRLRSSVYRCAYCTNLSGDPCERQVRYDDTLWVAMSSWNDNPGLHRAINSLQTQTPSFTRVNIVVFEDASKNMFSTTEKNKYADVVFLHGDTRTKMGSAYAKWRLFQYIKNASNPNDYVAVVDGDDVLASQHVLTYIHKELSTHKPWFAWGKINGKFEDQCGNLPVPVTDIRKYLTLVNRFPICHPRIFKSELIRILDIHDFQNANGRWLQKATDRGFIYKFLEYSGEQHLRFLSDMASYNYSWTPNNGLLLFPPEIIRGDRDYVNNLPPISTSTHNIHVVACMFDRTTSKKFIERIVNSVVPAHHQIILHICNNNKKLFEKRKTIASQYETVHVYNMKENYFGYGRFLLAREIMEKHMVDYFIMIDDDMFVRKHTIMELFSLREPQTFKSWYGKTWEDGESSYWRPKFQLVASNPDLSIQQIPHVKQWQYGGTGMSIIDASIFQVQTLFHCPLDFRRVEDIWLSYILQQVSWPIHRARVVFDIDVIQNAHGQWSALKGLKNKAFNILGRLRCNKFI